MSVFIGYIPDMDKPELTLEELSKRSGVELRTLRSWISEGLLSPPLKTGRGAKYPAVNADRALAVRVLKDLHGMSLAEIGRRFLMASDEQIRSWALEAGQTSAPAGSAREYLRSIQQQVAPAAARQEPSYRSPVARAQHDETRRMAMARHPLLADADSDRGRSATDRTRIEALILSLERLLADPAPRRSQSTLWTRISITADLELSVRGELSPSERGLFEQLADQLRALLTGRTKS